MWYRNKGKCGVCGDPYDGRRDNEAGGKYATGQIVAQFGPEEVITSTVQLTVNHGGYFEFDLCPVNQPNVKATENCFARYPLSLPDGRRMFILPDRNAGYFHVPLRLPPGLTCRQCVFRWKYVTGMFQSKSFLVGMIKDEADLFLLLLFHNLFWFNGISTYVDL